MSPPKTSTSKSSKTYQFPASARGQPAAQPLAVAESPPFFTPEFYKEVRPYGSSLPAGNTLFLPASSSESARLSENWTRFPNRFGSAFELPRYASREGINLSFVQDEDQSSQTPSSFYPDLLVRHVDAFAEGPESRSEGYYLFQALVSLQHAVTQLINCHYNYTDNRNALLKLLNNGRLAACLEYYRMFWHRTVSCPLFAAVFIALFCEYCEEYLEEEEYSKLIHDKSSGTGYGMSSLTRRRVKMACPDPTLTLTSLAIPVPFDPLTREGQLILAVTSKGPSSVSIRHPISGLILRPDTAAVIKIARRRSLSSGDEYESGAPSLRVSPWKTSPRKQPVAYDPDMDMVDDDEPPRGAPEGSNADAFKIAPGIRKSIARAAKAESQPSSKTGLPTSKPFIQVPAKHERQASTHKDQYVPEPAKKMKSRKAAGKTRAVSPAPSSGPALTAEDPDPYTYMRLCRSILMATMLRPLLNMFS
ncbi:hypothetical protein FB446DRAFT_121542 [Lentinula raphanica]|nr:hypothetical protein FB446DRAFT_121542 [Lentinula raphanica]